MLFNSYEFIFIFLPITLLGYFGIASYGKAAEGNVKGKQLAVFWLVVMSFIFYGYWDYHYVPLLFASITFNYLIGQQIEKTRKKSWLTAGIIVNVLLLGYYKYTGFFIENINEAVGMAYEIPNIILPLGISFFTFTQSAYLVDAYRGEAKNTNFLTYCEFVTIFPHLIAGPIINHKDMIPQFWATENFKVNYNNLAAGITLFFLGLFKKVVIADRLSPWVADVFSRSETLTMTDSWIGAIAYTLQLYFDFSGYSEMAIGLGFMLNMNFPVNFNSPYQSHSIIDFWRRWHMTLGSWVRNYLYIPMGGNRHGEFCKMRNLFVSMAIIGFWHGAGWTFILWGSLHGFFLMINHQWRRLNINLPKLVNCGITFLCVVVCWVFFRANTFQEAINVLSAMVNIHNIGLPAHSVIGLFPDWVNNPQIVADWKMKVQFGPTVRMLLGLLLVVFLAPNPVKLMDKFQPNWKWGLAIILLGVFTFYSFSHVSDFLYFQF